MFCLSMFCRYPELWNPLGLTTEYTTMPCLFICDIVCISLEEIQYCRGLVLLDYFQDIFICCNVMFLGGVGEGGFGDSIQELALVFPFATE